MLSMHSVYALRGSVVKKKEKTSFDKIENYVICIELIFLMRPDFDGIPPPENIWGPDMREWIRARTERG